MRIIAPHTEAKMRDKYAELVRALIRAVEEQGRPNSFAPSELTVLGAPPPIEVGRMAQAHLASQWVEHGGTGEAPTYQNRRFYFT